MRPSSRPRSSASPVPAFSEIESIDALFQRAGLVRSPRRPQPRSARPSRLDRLAPEELAPPLPVPRRAPNGVEWLPIPGWDLPWLCGGFSTRKGGLSRAYCAEDAPGELNLGFTAADDRETVLANRRLLAEAVTGDAATPLLALKQFHSNLVIDASAAPTPPARHRAAPTGKSPTSPVCCSPCKPPIASRFWWPIAGSASSPRSTRAGVEPSSALSNPASAACAWPSAPGLQISSPPSVPALRPAATPWAKRCSQNSNRSLLTRGNSSTRSSASDPVRTKYPMLFLTQRAPGHSSIGPSLHVDLIEANRRQLLACGLSPRSVQVVGGCTQCQGELFFSHRASHGHAGRMMAVIGIREAGKARSRRP